MRYSPICLLMLLLPASLLAAQPPQAALTAALLPTGPGQARIRDRVTLLEQQLFAHPLLTLLERARIDALLDEQRLALALGPDQGAQRLAIGQLLRADLLILVHAESDPQAPLRLVVSESHQGLRLASAAVTLSDDALAQSQSMITLITRAAEQARRSPEVLVALPPLTSLNLTWEHAREGRLYAHVLQSALSHLPNVWFIELDEAQSVAAELERSQGERGVQRPLPIVVTGEYRHDERGQTTLTLTAQQGNQTFDTLASPPLAPQEVAHWLRETAAQHLASQVMNQAIPMAPLKDSDQLAAQAGVFVQLGMLTEALALTEACLLVDPDRLDQRIRALRLISALTPSVWGEPRTPEAFDASMARALAYWRSAQPHLDLVIHQGIVPSQSLWADGESQWWALIAAYAINATNTIDQAWDAVAPLHPLKNKNLVLGPLYEARTALRERFLKLLEQQSPEAQSTALVDTTAVLLQHSSTLWNESRKQRHEVHLRFLRAVAGRADVMEHARHLTSLPSNPRGWYSEAFTHYWEEVAKLPSPPLQERARRLLDHMAAYVDPDPDDTLFTRLQASMQLPDPSLRKLILQATDDQGKTYPVFPTDWLACGEKYDLVWERHRRNALYLLREPGRLEHLATFDLDTPWLPTTGHTHLNQITTGHGLHHPCYDGKYLWAPVVGPQPLLLVIDPETRQTWRLGAEIGLPPMNRGAAAIGIEPGTICLTGSFVGDADQPIRAWCAILRFDPKQSDHPQVEIFHQAIEQMQREAPENIRWTGPNLGFRAGPMVRYTDPQGKPWAVAWRKFETAYLSYNPLWIDLEQRQVVTRGRGPWSMSRHAVVHDQRLLFLTIDATPEREPNRLMSLGAPHDPLQTHARELPRIHQPIVWQGAVLGVDENGLAQRIAPGDGRMTLLDPHLPRTDVHTRLFTSAHLGLVMLVPVALDRFLCEAYLLTNEKTASLPASFSTTAIPQPPRAAMRSIHPGHSNLDVMSLLGRPYETTSTHWFYGGPRKRHDQFAFDFSVVYDAENPVKVLRSQR